jgi:hypothetical protein
MPADSNLLIELDILTVEYLQQREFFTKSNENPSAGLKVYMAGRGQKYTHAKVM